MFADPLDALRAVCVLDPAIDRVRTPLAEYANGRDPSLVVEQPGRHALWCTLRPLSCGDFILIDRAPSASYKLHLAFAYAVEQIDNWGGPGVWLRGDRALREPDGSERLIFSDELVDAVYRRCGAQFVYELGGVAYERATQGNGWSGSVSYTLPLSSQLGLERIARHAVEQERRIAGIASSAKYAPASPTTNSPSSGVDTGAPAPNGAVGPDATAPES